MCPSTYPPPASSISSDSRISLSLSFSSLLLLLLLPLLLVDELLLLLLFLLVFVKEIRFIFECFEVEWLNQASLKHLIIKKRRREWVREWDETRKKRNKRDLKSTLQNKIKFHSVVLQVFHIQNILKEDHLLKNDTNQLDQMFLFLDNY